MGQVTVGDELRRVVGGILSAEAVEGGVDALRRYVDLVLRWNRTHNLTGYRTREDFTRLGVIDSLLAHPLLPPVGVPAVDVGSGGGLPAIPLAVVEPQRRWILLEPRRKRASFLMEACHQLKLAHVEVRRDRLAGDGPPLALVTSRAVGGIDVSIAGRLVPGGSWVVATTREAVEARSREGGAALRLADVVEAQHEPGDDRCWARWVRD